MRRKIFKYGNFTPSSTYGNWKYKKFKGEEETLNFIIEQNKTYIPIHCAICYFYKENINHESMYILKYKEGIYD